MSLSYIIMNTDILKAILPRIEGFTCRVPNNKNTAKDQIEMLPDEQVNQVLVFISNLLLDLNQVEGAVG